MKLSPAVHYFRYAVLFTLLSISYRLHTDDPASHNLATIFTLLALINLTLYGYKQRTDP